MFDCSRELENFYKEKVVLPDRQKKELLEKRKLNIKRIKSGLIKYNEKNDTNYKITEDLIQGSVAMSTIVQNESGNIDIDVGIVFDKENLNLSPVAIRNVIVKSLDMEMYQFSEPAKAKTSCVRVKYSKGYHIDFAIYKRSRDYEWQDYKYEHAGAKWQSRDIRGIDKWFDKKRSEKENLRPVVRLIKMFCNSRISWNMPSGLVQTILCEENLCTYEDRIDIVLYKTIQSIVNRLNTDTQVNAPVDNNRKLVTRNTDEVKVTNFKNRLFNYLQRFEILFDENCTYEEAIEVWGDFFNHPYWTNLLKSSNFKSKYRFDNTEQFIHDEYEVDIRYKLKLDCRVEDKGNGMNSISSFPIKRRSLRKKIPHNFSVYCEIGETNCTDYDKVLWKVRNVGRIAEKRNKIRGTIEERGSSIKESTLFEGNHYIECFLIKDGTCVARDRINVPVGEK